MTLRIITGISLTFLITVLLLFASTNLFFTFFFLVILLCTIEWSKINKIKYFTLIFNLSFVSLSILYLLILNHKIGNIYLTQNLTENIIKYFINLTPIWGLIFIKTLSSKKNNFSKFYLFLSGTFIFLNFMTAILDIRFNLTNQVSLEYVDLLRYPFLNNYKPGIILLSIIFLTALNDSGAYFLGKFFGKNKLAPNISPNKTIEGLIGGIVTGIVFSIFLYYYLYNIKISITNWIFIVFVLLIAGNLGDLFESKLKRVANVKDSGNILPGHGGMLDRLDSHLVVIPTFWFFMLNLVFK